MKLSSCDDKLNLVCPIVIVIQHTCMVSYADTTDVQAVTATQIEGVNALTIKCEFITGSNATGCMVVLTGFEAYRVNLTKNQNSNSTTLTVTLEHPQSCYTGVEAFDIEADGSVGSLAVPGQLKLGTESETPCTPTQTSTCKIENNGNSYIYDYHFDYS